MFSHSRRKTSHYNPEITVWPIGTSASRYNNCFIDGGIGPDYFGYPLVYAVPISYVRVSFEFIPLVVSNRRLLLEIYGMFQDVLKVGTLKFLHTHALGDAHNCRSRPLNQHQTFSHTFLTAGMFTFRVLR
jgi:hypothetical protein